MNNSLNLKSLYIDKYYDGYKKLNIDKLPEGFYINVDSIYYKIDFNEHENIIYIQISIYKIKKYIGSYDWITLDRTKKEFLTDLSKMINEKDYINSIFSDYF